MEFNINTTAISEVFELIHATYGAGKILNYSIKPFDPGKPSLKSICGKIEVLDAENMDTKAPAA